jgi:hypothetical protein
MDFRIPAHRLIFRPLGREAAHGMCDSAKRTIELDPRAPNLLLIFLHELEHLKYPKKSETAVWRDSRALLKSLDWSGRARLYKALGKAHVGNPAQGG